LSLLTSKEFSKNKDLLSDELMKEIEESSKGAKIFVGHRWPRYAVPWFFHWSVFRDYDLKLAYLIGVGIE